MFANCLGNTILNNENNKSNQDKLCKLAHDLTKYNLGLLAGSLSTMKNVIIKLSNNISEINEDDMSTPNPLFQDTVVSIEKITAKVRDQIIVLGNS